MKNCPNCNNKLTGIDTRGVFAFENRSSRVGWFIAFTFIIIVCSAFILVLLPKATHSIALLLYYPLAFYLLYKIYKKKLNTIIYECTICKNRFKGETLEDFNYGN